MPLEVVHTFNVSGGADIIDFNQVISMNGITKSNNAIQCN